MLQLQCDEEKLLLSDLMCFLFFFSPAVPAKGIWKALVWCDRLLLFLPAFFPRNSDLGLHDAFLFISHR